MLRTLFAVLLLSLSSISASVYHDEHQALIDFYHSTKGPDWIRQDNWLSENHPHCEWHGVICNEDGHVIELQLYDNGLEGPLPESLCQLKQLKTLYLSFNKISGEIPASLGASTPQLENVWLKANRLEGEIPATLFQGGNLKWVDLHVNNLTGQLPYMETNPQLTVLRLDENQLSGHLPDSLFNQISLTELYLHDNQFSGLLSPELEKLTELQHLFIGHNQFSEALPDLSGLQNLISLRGEYNDFTGEVPESLSTLPHLQVLRLDHNHFNTSFSNELLEKGAQLQVFDISNNKGANL